MIAVLPHQADAAWFACLGLPLAAGDLRDAAAYLAALGYPPSTPIRGVPDWPAALALARDPAWDRRWWDEEQAERARLMRVAEQRLGRDALLERLSAGTELAGQAIHGAAAIAAAIANNGRDAVADAALVRAASGAASMALNAATLARLAGQGPEHLFMRKYALFESGRWPLGVVGSAFHLF
ncbi:MAG TPA: hypothetical protein VD791_06745 [Burkholderiales bacterium]|nr:hypothetical protein [Burkholderiales bacterium]